MVRREAPDRSSRQVAQEPQRLALPQAGLERLSARRTAASMNLLAKHYAVTAPGWSSGRTPGFEPDSAGSTPAPGITDLLARLQAARERTRAVDDPQLTLLEGER